MPALDHFCQLRDNLHELIQRRKERTMQIIELRTKGGMRFKLGKGLENFEDRVESIEGDVTGAWFIVKTSEGHRWTVPFHNLDSYVEGNVEMVEKVEPEYERSTDDGGAEGATAEEALMAIKKWTSGGTTRKNPRRRKKPGDREQYTPPARRRRRRAQGTGTGAVAPGRSKRPPGVRRVKR